MRRLTPPSLTALIFTVLMSAVLWPSAGAAAPELLAAGDYARAFESATTAGDPLTATQAAVAAALYGATSGNSASGSADQGLWLERAVSSGRAAVQAAPQSARAHLELGTALCLQAGRGGFTLGAYRLSRACRAEYERSLALDAGLSEARAALARWHSGAWARAGLIGGGDPATARRLAAQALREAPQNVRVVVQVATAYLELRATSAARTLLERSLALSPQDAQDRDLQAGARATLAGLR
ncbi:tetratricopeptide repeat protein [Deinococcus koreensis]|uniref:Uncharacterized protein n=1 Tax=Deinococcus koreensis TaxID=2054903 RepID=A0A2K3UZU0_9DEIO|nr:tetratricopeptide repeat protein [Deinococcus koreensis]PNY82035.1 hypothetical protein CVO96_12240 [Deinococcus koreensis]